MKFIEFGFGILFVSLAICHGKLPSSITVCSRNDPDLSECIIRSVKKVQPLLGSGNLGDNFTVPALEPLELDTIKMERGSEFNFALSDIVARGGSNFVLEKLNASLDNITFDFVIQLPKIEFTAKYKLKIKLLFLNIAGKGDAHGVFGNSRARVRIQGANYEKDGRTHLRFEKFTIKIKIEKHSIELKNLFNGDPSLGQIGNQFINQNGKLFMAEIIPGLEKNLAAIFANVSNDIIASSTYDELFPDIPVENIVEKTTGTTIK